MQKWSAMHIKRILKIAPLCGIVKQSKSLNYWHSIHLLRPHLYFVHNITVRNCKKIAFVETARVFKWLHMCRAARSLPIEAISCRPHKMWVFFLLSLSLFPFSFSYCSFVLSSMTNTLKAIQSFSNRKGCIACVCIGEFVCSREVPVLCYGKYIHIQYTHNTSNK